MKQQLQRALLIGAGGIVVAGALAIPFVYESQTLWYKMGAAKTLLRAGQVAGLLAMLALMVQILLGIRGKLLEKIFGVAGLMTWHRANGIVLCCLVIFHILLVLVPEGMTNLPIGLKYWPEMVGGILLLLIFVQTISSFFRQQFGFIYKQWRAFHRFLGYLALCLATLHVLFVADSFAQGVPRMALLVTVSLVFFLIIAVKISKFKIKNK